MTSLPVSPLAPDAFPELPAVAGVRLATRATGIRYRDRTDVLVVELAPGTSVAGTFTRSLCPSAPVDWCRSILFEGTARALVCNSGNANAFTGQAGASSARSMADAVAGSLGVAPTEVFVASTGVIGELMPDELLARELPQLAPELADADPVTWAAAADAIRTTDTFAKGSSRAVPGTDAVVVGIAKGSGMIAPDMATMLAFVFTDLAVAPELLQRCLRSGVDRSFNCITVDSDTSTSDTVLLFATGASGASLDPTDETAVAAFAGALDAVLLDLATQVVRDGEGATKFIEVQVDGAADEDAARTIALAIANSPLVKTALAAEDANWGRLVMAVGKSGQAADRDALSIWIGDELTAEHGVVAAGYSEDRATEHLRGAEIRLRVDVGVGDGSAVVWTCDLTHGYIDINAGYRS